MKPTKEFSADEELIELTGGSEGQKESLRVTEEAREKHYEHPSFGKQLFQGEVDLSLLIPFPTQSEEDKKIGDEYIAKIESFLKKNLDPEEVDRTHEIPKEVIEGLAKLGAFALKIPKEYGGLGLSQTNYNRVVVKVASYCGATAVLLSAHQSIGVPQPLLIYGTEEQKRRFLPRFREGAISAFALTEEDVGSDPARMSATADLSEDGSNYILNGKKLWCTNGTIADIIVVMAKTKPKIIQGKERQQISAFILEMDTPGVEITHRCEFMGLGGIYNGVLEFHNVKIPKENLIGEEGRGLAMALGTINVGRLTLPAASLGGAKQMLSIARRWGKKRKQWGQAIGQHEAGREKIAYIASTTFAMEAISLLLSAWQDSKKVDLRIEGSMGKYFSTEAMWKIVDQTLQLRGGRGYETARSLKARGEEPFPVERAMRDVRINLILEGSSEIMRLFLAREAIDPHLQRIKPLLSSSTPFGKKISAAAALVWHYAVWVPRNWILSWFTSPYKQFGTFAPYMGFVEKSAKKLALKIFFGMARHRQGLEKRQLFLGKLMDIGTELFAISAVCAYAKHLKEQEPQNSMIDELGHYFCKISMRSINENFYKLTHNDDRALNLLAKKVLDDQARFLEEGILWIGKEE